MRINEVEFRGEMPVEGYGPGFWRVGGEVVRGPVLLGPGGLHDWAGLEDVYALVEMAGRVDVLFLGMGSEIAPVPRSVREAVELTGQGLDVMASPTAARSYNVLLSEGRRVAAALIPVGGV
ncbi:Mth938-like domain-containing protein [Vannielia litorea]|uniref:Mth938-like domain-containing protein n=1 Tax=Vannielia litorea TaxID=1217970 RepID=UPI001C944B12|nr:Mth938-like domain-containing protein [Vannielia litorea]MBY6152977.1 Mth938-like domain-containing protein [Vannielia litorea]